MGNSESQVDMNSPAAKYIQKEVSSNPVVIFSKSGCPHCRSSKQLFQKLEVPCKVVELDKRNDCALLQDILGSMTGARTVPRVFVNGECLGGNSELQGIAKTGKLHELLEKVEGM